MLLQQELVSTGLFPTRSPEGSPSNLADSHGLFRVTLRKRGLQGVSMPTRISPDRRSLPGSHGQRPWV